MKLLKEVCDIGLYSELYISKKNNMRVSINCKGTENMFEIIVEENCANREYLIFIASELEEFIKTIVSSQNLDSLKYLVVADSDVDNYSNSVKKFARILGRDAHVTNDGSYYGAGKTIEGFVVAGEYAQVIIIKSTLIFGMYTDLLIKNGAPQELFSDFVNLRDVGLITVIHEIGHAVDNDNVYRIRGCVNDKIFYNLDADFDEYVENTAYSLWGEYFAESFSYRILSAMELVVDNKEEQLKDCIEYFSKEKNWKAIVERVYRILYLYVHSIARLHNRESTCFDYEKYAEGEIISDYIPFLIRTEMAIVKLLGAYPKWNVEYCMDEIGHIIRNMIEFEREH